MAIEVTHKIDASDLANQIATGVKDGLSSFSQALEKLTSSVPVRSSGGQRVNPRIRNSGGSQEVNNNQLARNLSSLTTQITQLTSALNNSILAQKEMISSAKKGGETLSGIATLPAGERKKVIEEVEAFEKSKNSARVESVKEMMEMYAENRNSKRMSNIGFGLLSGAGMAAIYQASNWGQLVGSQAQSVNAGANNYGQFLNQYYGSTLDTQKSMISTGVMGAVGLAGLASGGAALPVMLGAGVAGGIANYLSGKDTEETKAANQLAFNQDLMSYKLRAYGISNLSSENMMASGGIFSNGIKIPLTELQSYMKDTKGLSGYVPNIEEALSSTRLDVAKNMSTEQQGKYVERVSRLAQLTNSSVGETASAVSKYAGTTGESADTAINVILKHQLEYQGDMKSNIGKIVQLMQGAGLTADQASELVGKYQYNDAMLQNKIVQDTMSPTNTFLSGVMADIIEQDFGIKEKDIPTEYIKMSTEAKEAREAGDMQKVSELIIPTQLMENYAKYTGINLRAQDIGGQNPSVAKYTSIDDIPQTNAQKVMLDKISEAFKKINANTMHVNAGTVILNSLPQSLGVAGAADAFKKSVDVMKDTSAGKAVGTAIDSAITAGQSAIHTIREEIPPIVGESFKKAQQRIKGIRENNNSNASAKPVGLLFENYTGAPIVPASK